MIYILQILAIYAIIVSTAVKSPPVFVLRDFVPDPKRGIHGAEIAYKKIAISNDITFDAVIEVSSHGNGSLTIANLKNIKVYNSGGKFRNTLLNIKFADFDGDGYRDLIIYGIEDFYGEKDDNLKTIRGSRLIIHLYRFNPKQRRFETIFKYAPDWKTIYY